MQWFTVDAPLVLLSVPWGCTEPQDERPSRPPARHDPRSVVRFSCQGRTLSGDPLATACCRRSTPRASGDRPLTFQAQDISVAATVPPSSVHASRVFLSGSPVAITGSATFSQAKPVVMESSWRSVPDVSLFPWIQYPNGRPRVASRHG